MKRSIVTTEALVLRRHDLGESDRIVVLLTPEKGIVRAVGKAARKSKKRFGGILDVLYHLEVELTSRRKASMPLLTHARLIDGFPALSGESMKLAAAAYLAEVAASFSAEDQAEPEMFGLLIASLRALANGLDPAPVSRVMELQALAIAGLAPRLDVCTITGRKLRDDEEVAFEPLRGGAVCLNRAEEGSLRLLPETRRLMQTATSAAVDKAWALDWSKAALAQARAALGEAIAFHLGRPLRARAFAEASARFLREQSSRKQSEQ